MHELESLGEWDMITGIKAKRGKQVSEDLTMLLRFFPYLSQENENVSLTADLNFL